MDNDTDRDGAYKYDLWCHLETTINLYEQERERYWHSRVESEDWSPMLQLLADADEIAKLIMRRAFSLTNTGEQDDTNSIYRVYHEELDRRLSRYKQLEEALLSRLTKKEAADLLKQIRPVGDIDPLLLDEDEPLRLVWGGSALIMRGML